jgi:DnaJ-class molecular chaperone
MSADDPDQDLYLVLGLDPAATPGQITHAYRALMRRHHPDTRAGSTHTPQGTQQADTDTDHDLALRRIVAAYTVLCDPQRRADYDARRARQVPRLSTQDASRSVPEHTGPPVILGDVRPHGSRPARTAPAEEPPAPSWPLDDLLRLLIYPRRR